MDKQLFNKKILVMVANGVDEASMSVVQRELMKTGAAIKTAGMEPGLVNSWNSAAGPMGTWGLYFPVDQQISLTLGSDFDCLVVPSGARGIQKLAASPHSERIIASFLTAGKPVAFMGDAATLLEKTGLGASQSEPNVLTGDCADLQGFVARMLAHFSEPQLEKIAA